MGYHTCFVRLMHKQTSLQFATFETHMLCQYSSQKFCEISAGCSHAIHRTMQSPNPSIAFLSFRGRANISQDESACMKAHTRSPVSTRRSNHAAYSNSPRTDNGECGGANTSSLPVVAKSFSTHLDLTSLPFNRRAQPVRRIDLLGGMSVFSGLDFVGGQSIDQGAFICCSNRQVCVRPSFLDDIKFYTVLSTN